MVADTRSRSSPLGRRLRRLGALERREEAVAFIRRFHRENGLSDAAYRRRKSEVTRALTRSGFYTHTPEELAFGARIAWRNHARCIGRLFWESLEVVDARHVTDPDEIMGRMMAHMSAALGDGRIRSLITVFAPVQGDQLPAYIESRQITQYAGYALGDGRFLGDRENIEQTRTAQALGWSPPDAPSHFDFLPVLMRDKKERRLIYELDSSAVREVPITHPERPEIGAMGLRWYAVPCISNMLLTIGGIDYPCAPFNGFYMGTEIASRDLADRNRYDLLADTARALGDDPDSKVDALWKDNALLELNRAVLHSFSTAGVTMVDHHTASDQYMEFIRREFAAGRMPSGDWSWIVPPQASAATEVFKLSMEDTHQVPNYYTSRATDGAQLKPNYDDEDRSRLQKRWDRLVRRYRNWRRARS